MAKQVDLAQLPQDDDVYKVLRAADTVGMFQVESRAQMASLPRNAPKIFYDLVVQVAIIQARADCRQNDASIYAATGRAGK